MRDTSPPMKKLNLDAYTVDTYSFRDCISYYFLFSSYQVILRCLVKISLFLFKSGDKKRQLVLFLTII